MFRTSSPDDYFRKANDLLCDCGQALRDVFQNRWEQATKSSWRSTHSSTFISGVGAEVYASANDFQKRQIERGKLYEWDISLLCDILLLFENLKDDWEKRQKERSAIHTIRRIRNQVAHNSQQKLSKEAFETLEKECYESQARLGYGQNSLVGYIMNLYNYHETIFFVGLIFSVLLVARLWHYLEHEP